MENFTLGDWSLIISTISSSIIACIFMIKYRNCISNIKEIKKLRFLNKNYGDRIIELKKAIKELDHLRCQNNILNERYNNLSDSNQEFHNYANDHIQDLERELKNSKRIISQLEKQ